MARTADRADIPALGAATLDVERHLWTMADGLRGHMDAAGYKYVVLASFSILGTLPICHIN